MVLEVRCLYRTVRHDWDINRLRELGFSTSRPQHQQEHNLSFGVATSSAKFAIELLAVCKPDGVRGLNAEVIKKIRKVTEAFWVRQSICRQSAKVVLCPVTYPYKKYVLHV